MELISFLQSKRLFSEEECIIIDRAFKKEIIPKRELVTRASSYSYKVIFIESGILRTYYLQDGKDITHFFFEENYFMAPVNSLYFNQSERYNWEAVEQCKIRVIQYEEFLALEERFPKLTRVLLDFSLHMLDLFSQKLNLLQFQTAFDRYHLFVDMYPNLQNRVSLGSTASFLGITQQTLSVIRSQKK
ncbi:MAG: Crp/Fnr family transcriptional regulator [Bacteroidota bacterium]